MRLPLTFACLHLAWLVSVSLAVVAPEPIAPAPSVAIRRGANDSVTVIADELVVRDLAASSVASAGLGSASLRLGATYLNETLLLSLLEAAQSIVALEREVTALQNQLDSCSACRVPVPTFTSHWQTTAPDEIIVLPLTSDGVYNFEVVWGDGSAPERVTTRLANHTYATAGVYRVDITGTIEGFAMLSSSPSASKLTLISSWGPLRLGNRGHYFRGATKLRINATDAPDLSGTTNMQFAFYLTPLVDEDFNHWNMSGVTDMSSIFRSCSSLTTPGIDQWDTSSVTTLTYAFQSSRLFNADLSRWDVSAVTSLSFTFQRCYAFNSNVSHWNTVSVTSFERTFDTARAFNSPLTQWRTDSATSFKSFFDDALSFNQPVNHFDTSRVTTMSRCFNSASAFNQPVDAWDTSNVLQMDNMFKAAASFNQPLPWNTAKVTTMFSMFAQASAFNQPLTSFTTAKVTSLTAFVQSATAFNQDLDHFDTSKLTGYCTNIFQGATAFQGNIATWDVRGCTNMEAIFDGSNFAGDLSQWKTSLVTDFRLAFRNAKGLNPNTGLRFWDVSSCTHFSAMFQGSTVEEDLSSWTMTQATIVSGMFNSAPRFNSPLPWAPINLDFAASMFAGASLFNQDVSLLLANANSVKSLANMFSNAGQFNNGGVTLTWNTGGVTDFGSMFSGAASFNQEIVFDVSSATSMVRMFFNAASFNQDLSQWCPSGVTSTPTDFATGATSWDTGKMPSFGICTM